MVKSIFYKSTNREENALTHRFLAIYQRLSNEARSTLFGEVGLSFFHELKNPSKVNTQVKLVKKIPDGLIIYSDFVVAFENKVDTVHERGYEDLSQLKYYYTELQRKFVDYSPRLLVAADGMEQSRGQIRDMIKEQDIPNNHVDIMTWQDLYKSCVQVQQKGNSMKCSELDRFLIQELRILLEELKMGTYTGINLEDIRGYDKSWIQLNELQKYLMTEVEMNFSMLGAYGGKEGSIHRLHQGFGFSKEWDSAKLIIKKLRNGLSS